MCFRLYFSIEKLNPELLLILITSLSFLPVYQKWFYILYMVELGYLP
nr:MAG TPA: hypothetical protein [Caudoviricetes sp.]